MNFARVFRTPILYMIIYLIQIGVLKILAKFTAKFMSVSASGFSENRPCLAGCKLTVNQYLRCRAFPLRCSFQLSCTDEHPTTTYESWWRNTNDNGGISWCPDIFKGKLLNLVSLGFNFLADWRTVCLKFVKMFTKWIIKELRVIASLKLLNEVTPWS